MLWLLAMRPLCIITASGCRGPANTRGVSVRAVHLRKTVCRRRAHPRSPRVHAAGDSPSPYGLIFLNGHDLTSHREYYTHVYVSIDCHTERHHAARSRRILPWHPLRSSLPRTRRPPINCVTISAGIRAVGNRVSTHLKSLRQSARAWPTSQVGTSIICWRATSARRSFDRW